MKLQLLLLPCSAVAFAPAQTARASVTSTALYGYVPSGMTAEQWKALQDKEKKASKATDRKKYQSRSFNSFVEAMERGEATHLMPVDPRKVASGEIPLEDVPYMQRPGPGGGPRAGQAPASTGPEDAPRIIDRHPLLRRARGRAAHHRSTSSPSRLRCLMR